MIMNTISALTARAIVYIAVETQRMMVLIGSFFLPYRMYNAAAKRILKPPKSTQFTHIYNFSRDIPKSTDSIKMAMSEASLSPSAMMGFLRYRWTKERD